MRWDKYSDEARLNELAKEHGLAFRVVRSTYIFEEFRAHGLRQALGYVEGYDRCYYRNVPIQNADQSGDAHQPI